MSNLLSQLTKSQQARLLEELNYTNLEEIRGFCSEHGIPGYDEWFRREVEKGRTSAREGGLLDRDEVLARIDQRYRA